MQAGKAHQTMDIAWLGEGKAALRGLWLMLCLCPMLAWAGDGKSKSPHGGVTATAICQTCEPEDPPPPPPPPPSPLRDAVFVTQSLPTTMIAGQSYAVSVQMQNTGTATWTLADGYKLGSQNPADNSTWGMNRVGVSGSVASSQTATFNFTVQAPSAAGTYNFQWRMLDEGEAWFGASTPNALVTVTALSGSISASPNPCTIPWGGSTCTSSISWNSNASNAEVWVTGLDGSNAQLFASAQSSTQSATWITTSGARFHLKSGGSTLATADVGGTPTVNSTPSVNLTAPTNNQSFPVGNTVSLTATASDTDDGVQRVEFFVDGAKIGEDTTSPHSYTWTSTAGSHTLTAKAVDTRGAIGSSNAVTITGNSTVGGHIDGVASDGQGGYLLLGWACSTGLNQSISVHLYVGGGWPSGTFAVDYFANQASEAGVASACQAQGTNYRFGIPLTLALRQQHAGQAIYVHGISPIGGANNLLVQSGTFTVPAPPPSPPVAGVLTRRYVYDVHQQLCKVIEPETGTTVLAIDSAGNVDWTAAGLNLSDASNCNHTEAYNSGRRVQRTYDSRNRLTSLSFLDNNGNQSWTYTPDGLPAQITTWNEGGTTVINAYSYNKRRMLTGESTAQPGWYTWPIGYGYNANAHLTTLVHPGGETISYAPNALGQPTQATSTYGNYATGVSYYPNGGIAQFTYGNGIVHTLTQNTRSLPERSRDVYGGVAVLDDSYDFDANGNVAAISDALPGNRGNRTMSYDQLDRLKTTASPMYGATPASYSYDVLDNLIAVTAPGRQQTYWYDASNRLTNLKNELGASVVGLGYDVQGNLANKNGQTFTFDYGNRLRGVTNKEAYRYDGHGRRILAWSPTTGNILSHYGQDGVLRYQHDDRKSKVYNYIYLGGSLVATRETPIGTADHAIKYQHTDALGSPVAVTDANRNVIERSEYEPYGKVLNRPIHDGPGYTGHVEDAATGLTYMQQRYYDPGIGLFLSVDPVTANGSTGANFNRYWYANNNPYKFTDPDGRIIQLAGAAGGAAAGVVVTAVGDIFRGEVSSFGTYAGAFAGGAAAGAVLTTTGNPMLAGAAGGAVGSAVQQKIDIGQVNGADVATGAVVGGALGGVPGLKVPGLTSGRNSFAAVAKAAQTKLSNGTISTISPKTLGKAATASGVEGAAGAAVGDSGSRGVGKAQDAVRGAIQQGVSMPRAPSLPNCVAKACAGN